MPDDHPPTISDDDDSVTAAKSDASQTEDIKHDDALALNLIRRKLSTLFGDEPPAKEELEEVKVLPAQRSKHQQFMYDLGRSGKSLAAIQTEWHNYYTNLPDEEKHAVWQEFYTSHAQSTGVKIATALKPQPVTITLPKPVVTAAQPTPVADTGSDKPMSVQDIKHQLLSNVSTRSRTHRKQRGKSLLFGFSIGSVVLLMTVFGFFNERFIAPFITPSRVIGSTPIILDTTTAVGPEPKIIIPKINVDIPVIYNEPSVTEAAVQRALEDGVLHYGITSNPGQKGNAVIFGHSSNNILNRGKYKFAFVLLNKLEPGDTFMLHKGGKRYVYKVSEKKVVKPTETSVLQPIGSRSTVTLITCDPPGTSINRLVVIGDQISPNPDKNNASTADIAASQPATLPSNAPSLWQRFVTWLPG